MNIFARLFRKRKRAGINVRVEVQLSDGTRIDICKDHEAVIGLPLCGERQYIDSFEAPNLVIRGTLRGAEWTRSGHGMKE
jgi:hypothetical protein